MRIAFFGSSLVSAYWNGAATYYRGLLRALAGLGHEITFYEPDAFERQEHRDIADPDWARVVVYPATHRGLDAALTAAKSADVLVKASGVGVFDDELEAEVAGLGGESRTTIFWDVDAPATLERLAANPADPFRAMIPRYHAVLTYGGGAPVRSRYLELGARYCAPIYNAVDPASHFRVEPDRRYASDLLFIGNRLPDRESRVDEFFLKAARQARNRIFLLGGNGWDDKPVPKNVRRLGHVFTRDHNVLNSSAMAVLNVNRDSMARFGFSPPTRVFEAAGAGACLIADHWNGIEAFLAPGEEVLVAESGAAVAEHLERLTPEQARKIGDAAQRRILANHTYAHRAAQVDALLQGFESLGSAAE
jgi:spore maturation protein CgeB